MAGKFRFPVDASSMTETATRAAAKDGAPTPVTALIRLVGRFFSDRDRALEDYLNTLTTSATIPNTPVVPGTYGDASHVGQFTVGADGRLTFAANVAIPASAFPVGPSSSGGQTAKITNASFMLLDSINNANSAIDTFISFNPFSPNSAIAIDASSTGGGHASFHVSSAAGGGRDLFVLVGNGHNVNLYLGGANPNGVFASANKGDIFVDVVNLTTWLATAAAASTWLQTGGAPVAGTVTTLGFYGAAPVAQAALPVTLADVIAVLHNLGLTA